MGSTGLSKVSYFVAIYFSVYACHSRANLPKGKAVSVCEISLNPNKICEGNSLNFSLSTKGKVKGNVKGNLTDRDNFSLGQIRPGMTSIHRKINSHK